jgi:hypothetical protein
MPKFPNRRDAEDAEEAQSFPRFVQRSLQTGVLLKPFTTCLMMCSSITARLGTDQLNRVTTLGEHWLICCLMKRTSSASRNLAGTTRP